MARPRFLVGAGLVVLYVVAAGVTTRWATEGMRPLFDGFGSHPGQYNWVNPPKEFAEGNQPPDAGQAGVVITAEGSGQAAASTEDGQVLASIVPGALPPHPPDSSARIDVRPFDSARLGPLPAGLRAEGNAYRVSIVYLPSRTPVRSLTVAGTVGLTAVAPADRLLFSADGTRWERREARAIPQGNGLTGPMTETGYYLAAARGEPRAGSTASGGGGSVALYALGALVPLGLGYLLLGRNKGQRKGATSGGPNRPRPSAGGPRAASRSGTGKGAARKRTKAKAHKRRTR